MVVVVVVEDTQCMRSAVAGDGGSGLCRYDSFETGIFQDLLDAFDDFFRCTRIGDEDKALVRSVCLLQRVFDVFFDHFEHASAVFLGGGHASVFHDDLRFEVEKIGSEGCQGRASSSFVEVVHGFDDEGGLELVDSCLYFFDDGLRIIALVGKLSCIDGLKGDGGGQGKR